MKDKKVIRFNLIENALAKHYMTILRNKNTKVSEFRFALDKLSKILAIATVENFELTEIQIETPLEATQGQTLNSPIVIVPVLRAGLSMLPAFIDFLPEAQIGFIGQRRDEKSAIASEYYRNFPEIKNKKIIIIDPMLATGGSAVSTIECLLAEGGKIEDLFLACIIVAPEGLANLQNKFPQLQIFACALDRCLNEKKYILPGLGDAGDLWTGMS